MFEASPGTRKGFRGGTDRSVAPAETLARIKPLLKGFEITRVAHLTGLDRVGLPVVAVVRANSRSISVSQGKGLTLEAAEVSGLMESIESYHAERALLPLIMGSVRELRAAGQAVAVTGLPRLTTSSFHSDTRILWTPSVELNSGRDLLVPHELVHTDFRVPLPGGSGSFLMSSNGLASGNGLAEALSHAICELVERDANTLFHVSSPEQRAARRLDPRTVQDPGCRHALDCFENAALEVGIWETTSDTGLPSFSAMIVDRDPHELRPMPPVTGSGCHPRRSIALARALTEAAQGRLTFISGSRDDISARAFDEDAVRAEAVSARMMLGSAPHRSLADVPDFDCQTFEEDVELELAALARAGISEVVSVNLATPGLEFSVVRVIVPGLEAMSEVPGYALGARARRIIATRAAA